MAEEVKDTAGAENQQGKTYTKEEVEKLLQSESDRRVSEALKTAGVKWQAELESKLEQTRTEAERLAKLSAEEKKKEEDKKRAEELARKEHELTMRELQLKAVDELSQKKLPVQFAKLLLGSTAEETLEKISVFEKEFRDAVQEEVEIKLKGRTPQTSEGKNFDMNKFIRGLK